MTDTVQPPAVPHARRVLAILVLLATLIGNVIPLYGVLYWQWDTFQLLMLYWMETAIIAFWTLMRLAMLSSGERGEITVNGQPRAATQFALVGFFAIHSGGFIVVHLIFLWAFFSHEWLKKVHGAGSFFYELFVANYVWVALAFMIIASGISFLIDAARRQPPPAAGSTEKTGDRVGAIIGGLYARIVIMQIAIIFGAMISGMSGSLAPLVIVITLKTVIDIGVASYAPILKTLDFSSKTKKKIKIEM